MVNSESKKIHKKIYYGFYIKKGTILLSILTTTAISLSLDIFDNPDLSENGKKFFYVIIFIVTSIFFFKAIRNPNSFYYILVNIISQVIIIFFINISIVSNQKEREENKKIEIRETQKVEIEKEQKAKKIFTYKGEVLRIGSHCAYGMNRPVYHIRLNNYNGKHFVIKENFLELHITKTGDNVEIKTSSTESGVTEYIYFNNLDIYAQGEKEESNVTK